RRSRSPPRAPARRDRSDAALPHPATTRTASSRIAPRSPGDGNVGTERRSASKCCFARVNRSSQAAMSWVPNPFLHGESARVYNPLTDRALVPGDGQYEAFRAFVAGEVPDKAIDERLADGGWITRDGDDLSHRHHLKIVSLETLTTCNQ